MKKNLLSPVLGGFLAFIPVLMQADILTCPKVLPLSVGSATIQVGAMFGHGYYAVGFNFPSPEDLSSPHPVLVVVEAKNQESAKTNAKNMLKHLGGACSTRAIPEHIVNPYHYYGCPYHSSSALPYSCDRVYPLHSSSSVTYFIQG